MLRPDIMPDSLSLTSDSVAQAGHIAPVGPYIQADTLARADSLAQSGVLSNSILRPDSALYDATAEQIFGQTVHIVPATEMPAIHGGHYFSADIIYQLAVVALLVIWIYIVFRHFAETRQFLRLVFASKRDRRSAEDFQGALMPFSNAMTMLFFFSIGIASAKASSFLDYGVSVVSLGGMPPAWLIAVAVSLCLAFISLFKYVLLKVAGALTFGGETVKRLLWYKRIFMADFTVMATPAIILMSLSGPVASIIFGSVVILTALVLILWFVGKTLRLFMEQNISLLFWILYLCAAELMPISIVVLALFRYT